MSNERPLTRDEARLNWVRLYRKGREKGGWIYLDADLLAEAGIPNGSRVAVKRYALRPGPGGTRPRIMLNLRIVTETDDAPLTAFDELMAFRAQGCTCGERGVCAFCRAGETGP